MSSLCRGSKNSTYVNTDPEGNYSLSGSIFLDSRNQPDFSDFNNIIHGHHMAGNVMFGEIDLFEEEDFLIPTNTVLFSTNGQLHGIEFLPIFRLMPMMKQFMICHLKIQPDKKKNT